MSDPLSPHVPSPAAPCETAPPVAEVVLVTANHPFTHNGGETMFVAPEIQRLVQAGLRVRVAPLNAHGEQGALPEGATLDLGLFQAAQQTRWRWAWGTLSWPGVWRELGRALRHGGPVGVVRVLRWAAQAQATWRWARGLSAPWLGYTYWRGGATLALARLGAEQPGCTTISRVHGYELYEERFSPAFQPFVAMYASLAKVVTVSQHGHDYLAARGVPLPRLHLARLGCEAAVQQACGSDGQPWAVLSCSNLESLKRVPLLARTLLHLARQHPEQTFLWTHLGDGPQMPIVRTLMAQAPANLRVQLPGAVPHAAVLLHYQQQPVDVFVLLSRTEGLPVSVQEALAHGVPVLATDVGGTAEAVDAQVGHLLPAHPQEAQVAQALAGLLWRSTAAQRHLRRMAAHERWAQRFDAQANHAQFAQELRQLACALHP
jgi:glycosyltransferase involved in cell wall biosynthesis